MLYFIYVGEDLIMDSRILYLGIALAVLVVAGVVYIFSAPLFTAPLGMGPGTVVLDFGGMPISLRPVQGHDVECVGAPEGFTMVHFSDDSDEYGTHLTVGYAREGDYYETTLSWARSRAATCGFSKVEETSLAVPGAHGTSLHYESPDGDKELYFDVGVVKGSDGKEYTVVRVGYDAYYESTENQSTDAGESSGQQPQEISVSGDLKTWDSKIRPILNQVYGSVVLTSATQAMSQGFGFEYYTPREITSPDAQALVNAFVSAGWQQMQVEISGSQISLGFLKNNVFLEVDADVGTHRLSVTVLLTG